MNRLRLAIVVTHPIQYHAPLYRLLASSSRVEPEVLFLSHHGLHPTYDSGFGRMVEYDVPLTTGYRHRFLKNISPRPDVVRTGGTINPGLLRLLTPENFDAVLVHGYNHLSHWLAYLASRARGLPYLLRGESRLDNSDSCRWLKRRTKQAILGTLVRSAGACLAIGDHNRQFYEAYGAEPGRIVDAPYSVDNERFRLGGADGRNSRDSLLLGLGLDPTVPVVLFASKLQAWKRAGDLVEAVALMPLAVNLLVIGDGPLRRQLERSAAQLPTVRFLGFINQLELPRWYGAADLFVLPSEREPWGLAVNEAIAAGCVPVTSTAVGCAPDLLTSDRVYRTGRVGELAAILNRLCGDPDAMLAARMYGAEVIERHSLGRTAAGIELGAEISVLSSS